jgi:hypothetical protein
LRTQEQETRLTLHEHDDGDDDDDKKDVPSFPAGPYDSIAKKINTE